MRIQWGMMMTDGRGKLGGQVASKNRAGAYVRTKVSPSNPQTSYQGAVRSIFSILSKRWSAYLSESNRNEWNEVASSGAFAKTDVFGNARNPSGFNLFVGMNSLQQNTGGVALVKPPKKALFLEVQNFSMEAVASDTDMLTGNFTIEAGDIQAGTKLQVQATAAVSAGKKFVKNLYRDIVTIPVATNNIAINLTPPYTDKFGDFVDAEGKQVFVRVRQVVDGQATPWLSVGAIIEEDTP